MEVLIDVLIACGKILIHLIEPVLWLGAGFYRWWTSELPEVLTFEEDEPEPEPEPEWNATETPPETYAFVLAALLIALQITALCVL